MGATKRLAELTLQALNQKNHTSNNNNKNTKFSIVRFGNVLDSSGSVIPKFRDQIRKGGPLTLTHKEITRYFMTITEAAQLVIQAGALATGGDVFVLDMGEPIKIYDLAVKMIQLSGLSVKDKYNQKGDIEISTGLDLVRNYMKNYYYQIIPLKLSIQKFQVRGTIYRISLLVKEINSLENLMIENDLESILNKLRQIIIDYSPSSQIIDHTFIKKS